MRQNRRVVRVAAVAAVLLLGGLVQSAVAGRGAVVSVVAGSGAVGEAVPVRVLLRGGARASGAVFVLRWEPRALKLARGIHRGADVSEQTLLVANDTQPGELRVALAGLAPFGRAHGGELLTTTAAVLAPGGSALTLDEVSLSDAHGRPLRVRRCQAAAVTVR